MQSLSLESKIQMTRQRIRGWINEYGIDGVYVSFSGGKDSTVLLDIVRKDYPNVKAVFFDTGLEYPEIREFVKGYGNVDWIKPKVNFRQVIEKYGYPFISKDVSDVVYGARKFLKNLLDKQQANENALTDRQTDGNRIAITTINYADEASMRNMSKGGQSLNTSGTTTDYLRMVNGAKVHVL